MPSGQRQNGFKKKNSLKTWKIFFFWFFASIFAGVLCGMFYWVLSDLPAVMALEEYAPIESSNVYSSDGKLIAEFYIERRTFIPYTEIPEHVKNAFISVEDVRFYKHSGVDAIGILRAFYHDVREGSIVQGGSTITQQLAKMLFLKPDKSIIRKLKEAVLSIQIEKHYTKDEILGLYLNQVYFGTRAYGIEAASQTYFSKSAPELTISESALLASLPKAPSIYSPFKNPDKALERRRIVLQEMLKNQFITKQQYVDAAKALLPTAPNFRKYDAPYFVETLRQELEEKFGEQLYTAGYKIYSTVNLQMQKTAEDAVANGVAFVEKKTKKGIEAALVVLDLQTGHVKAMVGGADFWKNQFNRTNQALRQPGSAFKPIVYAAAITGGMTSSDTIEDTPRIFKSSKPGVSWSPKNYDGKYYGPVTLKTALAQSLNAATVNLASEVGIHNIIKIAKHLGIKSELQPYISLALGASDVTLIEMVRAYSAFATGNSIKPVMYKKIVDRSGTIVDETNPAIENRFTEEEVKEMKLMLKAVVEEGTGRGARILKKSVYGKTGTTTKYTDAWFVGFDDEIAVGVWVGRDDHTPIGVGRGGSNTALPIWIDFMKKARQ